jgi:putative ABC transport system permease protein
MNGALLLRTVLLRMTRFKLRTIFMGLGIMVGVLATVLLQTVVGSVNQAFTSFVDRAYPADGIVVMAGSGFMGGGGGARNNLKLADVQAVAASVGSPEWDPVLFAGARDVRNMGNSLFVSVAGYSEKAEAVRRRSVQEGEFFTADDVRSRANVALIGKTTAAALFPGESPIGAQLFVDNVPFEVKGILEPVGADPHGGDQDNVIWVPYTSLMDKILKVDYVSGTTFLFEDMSRAEEIKEEMVQILRERHQIGQGQEDDFSVITPVFMRETRGKTAKTWQMFVPMIAGTAFLISAAVILSIMQISIKGRTAEIGLRKAVGARSRDLQVQIVLEVLLVSLIASAVGILLAQLGNAWLAPVLAERFGVKEVSTPAMVIVVAVAAAVATGLLGGILPARRAAKLNPVKALK